MKKFSKILCIIAAVAVMVACLIVPASAASMQEPENPVNAEEGVALIPGWYMFNPSAIAGNEFVSLQGLFSFDVQGVKYKVEYIEFDGDYPFLEIFTYEFGVIRLWTDEGWFFPEARIFYVEELIPSDQVQVDFINLNFYYIGDSLEVPGAEPEGWYNNIYDLIVEYVYGGGILTPGMEFSASLVATIVSVCAFLLPVLLCVFLIKFLFAWRY